MVNGEPHISSNDIKMNLNKHTLHYYTVGRLYNITLWISISIQSDTSVGLMLNNSSTSFNLSLTYIAACNKIVSLAKFRFDNQSGSTNL